MSQFKVLKFTIEQDISIPTWVGYFAVPLGYGMGTIYVLLKFTRYLLGLAPMAAPHDLDHEVESKGHD